jgi:hypothetical protein
LVPVTMVGKSRAPVYHGETKCFEKADKIVRYPAWTPTEYAGNRPSAPLLPTESSYRTDMTLGQKLIIFRIAHFQKTNRQNLPNISNRRIFSKPHITIFFIYFTW